MDNNIGQRPEKKNYWFISILVILASIAVYSLGNNDLRSNTASVVPVVSNTSTEINGATINEVPSPASTVSQQERLSNDNYYVNFQGNTVHSPAYSSTVPIGATAGCRDGTYSFSQSRRGTCSHHGGVAEWLY